MLCANPVTNRGLLRLFASMTLLSVPLTQADEGPAIPASHQVDAATVVARHTEARGGEDWVGDRGAYSYVRVEMRSQAPKGRDSLASSDRVGFGRRRIDHLW
jgi:hypothetical protein